jgi:hypothetical protein
MKKPELRMANLLAEFVRLKEVTGFTAEAIQRDLNDNYLHPDFRVANTTVWSWLKNPKAQVGGERALALQAWVNNNNKNKK